MVVKSETLGSSVANQDPNPDPSDVNVFSKSNKQKNFFFKLVFVGLLKVNDEKKGPGSVSGSEAWIRGSGSTPKCHGFAALFGRKVAAPLLVPSHLLVLILNGSVL